MKKQHCWPFKSSANMWQPIKNDYAICIILVINKILQNCYKKAKKNLFQYLKLRLNGKGIFNDEIN